MINTALQKVSQRASEDGWIPDGPSVIRKAEEVLETLEQDKVNSADVVFVSVGGSDGTELIYLLEHSRSQHGILIEFNDNAANRARQKAKQLAENESKQIHIFTGDAYQKIDLALDVVDQLREAGKISKVVLTMHAVLHEFPDRGSSTNDIEGFLYRFLWRKGKISVLAIAREPCMPKGLSDIVYLRANCRPDNLAKFANAIRTAHPEFQAQMEPQAMAECVRMSSPLAIETLVKLFYIESFSYEIEERTTSFSNDAFERAFYTVFGSQNVRRMDFQTNSFDRLWKERGISLLDANHREIRPMLHTRLVATWEPPATPLAAPALESGIPGHTSQMSSLKDQERVTVRLYHWEGQPSLALDPKKWDVFLDWSEHFDRNRRRVPSPLLWNNRLIPQLEKEERRIRETKTSRCIRFQPPACLSAGIALGWTFRKVKHYTFEIEQPPDIWRSDAPIASERRWIVEDVADISLDESSKDLSVEISQARDVTSRVLEFTRFHSRKFCAKITLRPDQDIGMPIDCPTALAYACDAKRIIGDAVDEYQCKTVHLFYSGPLGLAIFLGYQFNAIRAYIQCYEEQQTSEGYVPTCCLWGDSM